VDNVSFTVNSGEIVGLIGPNGAGKSTFFNVVAGTLEPTAGRILFAGQDITHWSTDRRARAGLTRTFQIARGLLELTVMENLLLYEIDSAVETLIGAVLKLKSHQVRQTKAIDKAWRIARDLELEAVANERVAGLSGGQKKLVELGRALMAESKLLLLDEPAAGVSRSALTDLVMHLRNLRTVGMTFIIVEHDMSVIGKICDRVVVLSDGRLLAEGTFDEIKNNPAVQTAYLGTTIA
jgi:ABC-type branched-subunit amino acid transport system ATPase component